ncbi:MAG: transglutaminase domain-containing protein [Lawsonibacter sp.]|nr:transglutaminase domain-containing protein [Lawsonibacter sp.]
MKHKMKWMPLVLAVCLLCACAPAQPGESGAEETIYVDQVVMEEISLEDEAVPLAASPVAQDTMLLPVASGTVVKRTDRAVIDYSNVADGYVMVQFTASTDKPLRVQIVGPTTTYVYFLTAGQWTTFPMSDGNGTYKVNVLEGTSSGKYALVCSESISVTLSNEFAPFIRPNQYVDYSGATNTLQKAEELTRGLTDPLAKVEKVYDFVVNNLTYDTQKASSVKSGYLPALDSVLASKKGICFDYAALMAGMLRSQGVPCKLVVGYAGTAYHAWISVWTEDQGWVDGVIFFDGSVWQRMDPTFASSGKSSEAIMKYIGDGSNYTAKQFY